MSATHLSTPDPGIERTLRQYALGTLDEQARLDLEERLIAEPATFEMLGVIEHELTEDYVDGALAQAERAGYERHFLASVDHQRELEFIRQLRETATRTAAERAGWTSPSLVDRLRELLRLEPLLLGAPLAALAVLMGVAGWSLARQQQLTTQLVELRAARAIERAPQAHAQVQAAPPSAVPAPVVAPRPDRRAGRPPDERAPGDSAPPARLDVPLFAMSSALLRSEGSFPRITVPAGTLLVGFRLEVPGLPYGAYRVVLYDGNSDERFAVSGLRPSRQAEATAVAIVVPADQVSRGDYQLKVFGVTPDGGFDPIASYTFRTISTAR
jgi:hypothetical protein